MKSTFAFLLYRFVWVLSHTKEKGVLSRHSAWRGDPLVLQVSYGFVMLNLMFWATMATLIAHAFIDSVCMGRHRNGLLSTMICSDTFSITAKSRSLKEERPSATKKQHLRDVWTFNLVFQVVGVCRDLDAGIWCFTSALRIFTLVEFSWPSGTGYLGKGFLVKLTCARWPTDWSW